MGRGANREYEAIKKSKSAGKISLTNATIVVRLEDLVGAIATTTAKLVSGGNMETFDGLSDLSRGDNSSQSSSCSACCSDKPIESDLGETNADVLNVDVVKLRSFMSEYEQLKTTLDKVNDAMSIVKFDMETLRKENQQLKNEVNAKIDQIQVSDEMRQKDRTDFHRVRKIVEKEGLDTKQRLSNFFNETKKERIEHQRVLKVLEEKISLIMTENLELKEMQKQHLEEISVLKSKQTATEEFIDLSKTKIEEIKNAIGPTSRTTTADVAD